ncbi:HAMP domain-containing protein, partial [Fournierella sp.]
MRKSISSMYFSTTAILLIVSTAVMGLIQMYLVMGYFQDDKRSTLNDVVQVTAMQVQEDSPLRRLLEDESARISVQDQMKLIGRTSSTNLLLTDASGQVMLYTQNEAEQLIGSQVDAEILRQAQEEDGFFETGTLGGLYAGKYYTVGRVMRDETGAASGYVFASASAASLNVFVSDMFSIFVLSAGLLLLAASLLAIFVTNRLTTPLRRISEAARKFGSGDFSVRVPVDGNDEVAQLAVT